MFAYCRANKDDSLLLMLNTGSAAYQTVSLEIVGTAGLRIV